MTKISQLPTLTNATAGDIVPVTDVSDTTSSPAGTTKRITVADLRTGVTNAPELIFSSTTVSSGSTQTLTAGKTFAGHHAFMFVEFTSSLQVEYAGLVMGDDFRASTASLEIRPFSSNSQEVWYLSDTTFRTNWSGDLRIYAVNFSGPRGDDGSDGTVISNVTVSILSSTATPTAVLSGPISGQTLALGIPAGTLSAIHGEPIPALPT